MNKLLALSLCAFLSACATSKTKESSPLSLSSSPHEEAANIENVDTFNFTSYLDAPASGDENQCSDDQIMFLIKTPQEHWVAAENFYNALIKGNNLAQQFALKYYDKIEGKVSDQDFLMYQSASLRSLNYVMREQSQSMEKYTASMESSVEMYKIYKTCEPKLEKALKSKQVDPKQKGCEWSEYKSMVYDPFEIKRAFYEAITLEGEIQNYLFEVNGVISKHMSAGMTDEELTKTVNSIYQNMEQQEVVRRSKEYKERINMALERTYESKQQCLREPKKSKK